MYSASEMHFGRNMMYRKVVQGRLMGSCHWPVEGEGKANSFYGIQAMDKICNVYDFEDSLKAIQYKRECYHISEFRDRSFFYGGLVRCIN